MAGTVPARGGRGQTGAVSGQSGTGWPAVSPGDAWWRPVVVGLLAAAFLVLGHHWASDVLGGWLIGALGFVPASATVRSGGRPEPGPRG
jgi:hypothetical protein